MDRCLVAYCLSVKSFDTKSLLYFLLGSVKYCCISDHAFARLQLFVKLTILETEHPLVTVVFIGNS